MMHIDPKKRLSLYSHHFDEMRRDLDAYITRMFHIMEAKDTKAGTIALKIDFAVLEEQVKCENSPTGEREALIPHIGYKIAMTMQSKAERKGDVVGKGHEVIQDGAAYYIVTKEEASGQLNMFNSYDELPDENDGPDPDEDAVPDLDAEDLDLGDEDDE